ncbi:hypothetical protein ACFW04_013593 [Cataglyphis niger]
MIAPIFVNLQGFIIRRNFIVKEVAILRNGYVLSHYIFATSWLIGHHHGLQWEDENVPYSIAKRLITMAVVDVTEDEDSSIVYLADILGDDARNDVIIETLDADYEDIASLNKLDVINTMRCKKHLKNCDLQNVFKIFNCPRMCMRPFVSICGYILFEISFRPFRLEPYEEEENWEEEEWEEELVIYSL